SADHITSTADLRGYHELKKSPMALQLPSVRCLRFEGVHFVRSRLMIYEPGQIMRMNEADLHVLRQNGFGTRYRDLNSLQAQPIRGGNLSSEVGAGSRPENASTRDFGFPFRFNRNGSGAGLPFIMVIAATAITLSGCVSDSIAQREGQAAARDPSAMMRIA